MGAAFLHIHIPFSCFKVRRHKFSLFIHTHTYVYFLLMFFDFLKHLLVIIMIMIIIKIMFFDAIVENSI